MREANDAHRTRRVRREPIEVGRTEGGAVGDRLRTDQNQIRAGAVCTLEHEIWPMAFFVKLGATSDPSVGTPLALFFEELPFLPQSVLELTSPPIGAFAWWWLGKAAAIARASAAVARNQDDLSVARSRDERSKPYELVARRSQICDR